MIRRLVSLSSKLFTIRALVSLLFDRDDYFQSSAPFSPPNIFIFKATGVNPPWEGDCKDAIRIEAEIVSHLSTHPSLGRRLQPWLPARSSAPATCFQPTHLWEGDCNSNLQAVWLEIWILSTHPSLGRRLQLPEPEPFPWELFKLQFWQSC
jgi:hypothetical protein